MLEEEYVVLLINAIALHLNASCHGLQDTTLHTELENEMNKWKRSEEEE